MNPLTPREKLLIAVVIVLVAILGFVLVIDLTEPTAGPVESEADLNLVYWSEYDRIGPHGPQVVFNVTVSNDGHANGSATIRCTVYQGTGVYFGSYVISLSPFEVHTYAIEVDVPDFNDEHDRFVTLIPF